MLEALDLNRRDGIPSGVSDRDAPSGAPALRPAPPDSARLQGDAGTAPAGSAWSVRLFGQVFAPGPAAGILAAAAAAPATGPRLVATANIDHVIALSENPAFRAAYDGAAVRTLDGTPLVWLARLRGHAAARITGHDLLATALFGQPPGSQRVFIVCATDAVAGAIRDRAVLSGFDPEAIATCVPPFGFDRDAAYGAALAGRIRAHGTSLLVMGIGSPRSEVWVHRQGTALGTPVALSVGDAINVAAGLAPRAPKVLQRLGLEWAFRFVRSPRRLFRRYFVRSWRFLGLLRREFASDNAA